MNFIFDLNFAFNPYTLTAANGYKTRPFDRVLSEVRSFVEICKA